MTRTGFLAALVALAACGGSSPSPPTRGPVGYYLVIAPGTGGASFTNIAAPSGATVTLVNTDAVAHQIVSEAALGAFVPGSPAAAAAPFDSGPFTGVKTLVLKTGLPDGTVLPFYCEIHKAAEATPNGSITIQNGAPPQPPGGGGGGGY